MRIGIVPAHELHVVFDGISAALLLKFSPVHGQIRMPERFPAEEGLAGKIQTAPVLKKAGRVDLVETAEGGAPGPVCAGKIAVILFPHGVGKRLPADRMGVVVHHLIEEFVAEDRELAGVAHPGFVHFLIAAFAVGVIGIIGDEVAGVPDFVKFAEFRKFSAPGTGFVFVPEADLVSEKARDDAFVPRIVFPVEDKFPVVFVAPRRVERVDFRGVEDRDVDAAETHQPGRRLHIQLPGSKKKDRSAGTDKVGARNFRIPGFRKEAVAAFRFCRKPDRENFVAGALLLLFRGGSGVRRAGGGKTEFQVRKKKFLSFRAVVELKVRDGVPRKFPVRNDFPRPRQKTEIAEFDRIFLPFRTVFDRIVPGLPVRVVGQDEQNLLLRAARKHPDRKRESVQRFSFRNRQFQVDVTAGFRHVEEKRGSSLVLLLSGDGFQFSPRKGIPLRREFLHVADFFRGSRG